MTALDRPVERRDGPVWVGTSWKMTKTLAEARAFVDRIAGEVVPAGIQPFVIPPHTALAAVRERLPVDSPVLLGAQNAHWATEGAWTGEISMAMAADAGARLIEIGHSERRLHFGETDETVAAKTAAALRHDLIPLVCVGEPAEVRDAGRAASFIADQVLAALARVPATDVGRVLLAYEPIWAIGHAGRAARPEEVSPVLREIVSVVAAIGAAAAGAPLRRQRASGQRRGAAGGPLRRRRVRRPVGLAGGGLPDPVGRGGWMTLRGQINIL